ncbi:glycosyltransferase family 4 protein [Microcoleus sp. FACHB-1515]|uniref:glycosyltransferase family 4 protein n=1 Tax=Cyanophyceae TaxID=3028117 RepID=UPI001688F9F5|nr:glycosyltransferase family 4 protein [Microcoleus sp. FACHB-1515]MBD2090413.1 glycosyltransferase family 4 protein [Microcoleus sp. FACHB-1515]
MKTIAYLVNQYPKVSHSFVRREIAAIESLGVKIERFSIRSCADELVDPDDKQELERTRIVLSVGTSRLLQALIRTAAWRPLRFWHALRLTLKLSRSSDRSVAHHLAYLAEACVLLGWFAESSVTHIHAHFGTNSTTVAMLTHVLSELPYSFTVHGPEEFDRVREISLVEKIDRAAFIVAISAFGRSQLYRWCPQAQWFKLHVVHCGVDAEFFAQPTLPPETPRLVCVGRLCEQKGQLLLLEAASLLAAAGLQFQLVLVGDGPMRSQLEDAIDRLQLRSHVILSGWASNLEVRRQIIAARAMVLPSFAEGLPVVLMEALALGRPVISTYIAGIPELVDSDCGWLIPAGTIEPLAEAMRSALLAPPETLATMGKAGRDRVIAQHSITVEAAKLAALFQGDTPVEKSAAPALAAAALRHT